MVSLLMMEGSVNFSPSSDSDRPGGLQTVVRSRPAKKLGRSPEATAIPRGSRVSVSRTISASSFAESEKTAKIFPASIPPG